MIDVADEEYEGENQFLGSFEYEEWLAQGDANFEWQLPEDEWDAISLNYTSGTTEILKEWFITTEVHI